MFFLSHQLIQISPADKKIVTAGGFQDEYEVKCNSTDHVSYLKGKHEEADTCIIFHCVKSQSNQIVVQARDTDILVLLISHFQKMSCSELWLKAGTSKHRKYYPVHSIVEGLDMSPLAIAESLPAFHSLTGCDTTSYICGHSKKNIV